MYNLDRIEKINVPTPQIRQDDNTPNKIECLLEKLLFHLADHINVEITKLFTQNRISNTIIHINME